MRIIREVIKSRGYSIQLLNILYQIENIDFIWTNKGGFFTIHIFKYKVVFKLAFLWTFFSFVNNESSKKKLFYIPFVYGPGEGGETKFGHKKVSAN